MMKKEYQKPTMNVETMIQMQMLCGSLTNVSTTGLDGDLGFDDKGGDQGNAWARKYNGAWDDEEEEW